MYCAPRLDLMARIADSKLLVIGGAGFIGSHIVDQLIAGGAGEITVLDNFVRGKSANLAEALESGRVEVVDGSIEDVELLRRHMDGKDGAFHLAALWLFECVHEPRQALEQNVVGTYNVIEAAHDTGLPRLVYSSSASVYGNAREIPMTEDHPLDNTTMYGATKIAGEQFLRAFDERHGLDYVALRYMNAYGPRMDQGRVRERDREDARSHRPRRAAAIHGDGSQAYHFIHVSDIARANLLALESSATDAAYNVATARGRRSPSSPTSCWPSPAATWS